MYCREAQCVPNFRLSPPDLQVLNSLPWRGFRITLRGGIRESSMDSAGGSGNSAACHSVRFPATDQNAVSSTFQTREPPQPILGVSPSSAASITGLDVRPVLHQAPDANI